MARRNLITDDDRKRVRALHAAGLGRNDIARQMGRTGSTVTKIADELGITFDRAAARAATAALRADSRERRAALSLDLIATAERLQGQIFAPTNVFNIGGKDNVYTEHAVPQPPVRDQKDLVQAISTAVNASLKIDDHDDDAGTEEAKSMIGTLMAGLKTVYDVMQAAGETDDDDDEYGQH